jgi:hypothetical protein|tara:strand:- start:493 stop:1137 length:645 start_codon:yes stop_codon:yes gene_type:complete
MAKQLLREFFELCPDGNCVIDVLTENEKRRLQEGSVFLVGVCQKAGTKNGNGRVYPKSVLEREVENYQNSIRERRALGELDHPDDSVINLKNSSHLVTKMWWEGNNVMGKIEVLDTPSGRILKDLLKSGVKLGISSRGMGSVKESMNSLTVEDDFQLICFDMVSEPSTPGAYLSPQAGGMTGVTIAMSENKEKQPLTKENKIHSAMDDALKGLV